MKSLHHSLAVLMTVGLWALVMTDSDSEESGSSSADWSAADAPLQCQPLTIFLGKVVHMPYVNDPAAPDPSCLDICTDEMENYERGVISGGPAPGIACNAGNDVCVCLANWLDLGHTVNSDEAELYQHYYGGTAQFGSNLGTVSTELTHGTASGPTFWNAVAIMTHNSQLQRIRQWLRNNPQHGSSSSSARTSQGQADSFQTQQCFCAISIAYSSFRVDPSLCPLEGDYGIPGIPAMHAVGGWSLTSSQTGFRYWLGDQFDCLDQSVADPRACTDPHRSNPCHYFHPNYGGNPSISAAHPLADRL